MNNPVIKHAAKLWPSGPYIYLKGTRISPHGPYLPLVFTATHAEMLRDALPELGDGLDNYPAVGRRPSIQMAVQTHIHPFLEKPDTLASVDIKVKDVGWVFFKRPEAVYAFIAPEETLPWPHQPDRPLPGRLLRTTRDLIRMYFDAGFTQTHPFPGEYTLMINNKTMEKVRVYENGHVSMTDADLAGCYIRSVI